MKSFTAITFSLVLLALTAGACSCLAAEEATSPVARAGSTVNLPGVTVHGGDKKFIEATGKVSLTSGILEFIAVEQGGRDYESLFTLDCKPSALKFTLLLIGCETGAVPREVKSGEKAGDRLRIEVEWQAAGKSRRLPLEKLLIDRKTKKSPAELPWIFSGSRFVKDIEGREVFLADAEQAFISLWWNPAVLINVAGEFGNPYRGDDQGFEANAAEIPPKDTPIKLIFRKVSD